MSETLNLASTGNSPDRSTKSTRSHVKIVLPQLVDTGFQVLFHSPPGVLFTFPSRYCSSIGHQVVFSLGGWSPLLPTGFLVSCGTLDTARNIYLFRLRDFYPLWSDFPVMFRSRSYHFLLSATPYLRRHMVWALPRSLAATWRIVFLLSFPPGT